MVKRSIMYLYQMSELVQNVHDGLESPLKAYAMLKEMEDHLKQCIDQLKDHTISECEKMGGNFKYKGYQYNHRKGARIISYDNIEEWKTTKNKLIRIEEKYKAALNNYDKGLSVVDNNGEILEIPKVSFKKDSIVVKKLK